MELKGSKTEKNLWTAFAGESQARTKYNYYASQAKKDGYEQIAAIFDETANNEKEHAKLWFKYLKGGSIPDTVQNLKDCIEGEHYEWTSMYKRFARVAREEGFEEIAQRFEGVAAIEKDHQKRYDSLLKNVDDKIVFVKEKEVVWICRNCGHIHKGKEAPEICPVCSHPRSFFEVLKKNY